MAGSLAIALLVAPPPAPADTGPALQGDAARGATVYQRCMSCHSPDVNRFGPAHRGVFGRAAGSVRGYNYSDALKASGIVWHEAELDRWLTGPSAFVPGTKMTFKLTDPQERADVIAFLKTLK